MRMGAALLALLAAHTACAQQTEISLPSSDGDSQVRLDWQSVPGQTYTIYAATNLTSAAWTNLTPDGFTAPHVAAAFIQATTNRTAFYRVAKHDTDVPEVTALVPAANAIAVASNATVTVTMTDETGIDTGSICMSIGPWTNLTLAGSSITYSNGTLTFIPPSPLGVPGSVITNRLTVADTLGHTLTNYTWTFELSRPTIADAAFLPLTAPPLARGPQIMADGSTRIRSLPSVRPLDGTDQYHIVAVTTNTVVFTYDGTLPAISNGTLLVSFDTAYPFYRRVTSDDVVVNVVKRQITVFTTDIPLTDLLDQASFASVDFVPAQPTQPAVVNGAGSFNLLHVEYGDDLSGRVLCDNAGLKLWLPSASWEFVGDVDISVDMEGKTLRSFDASASGTLNISVSPEALFHAAIDDQGKQALIAPVKRYFGGMAGPLPVWVEVTVELNAGFDYRAEVSGHASTTVTAEEDLKFCVKLRDGKWTQETTDPPITLNADPLDANLEGNANVRVYIEPKLTALVYSLAGLWVNIEPYAEVDYQASPLQWEAGIYFGLTSTLGVEHRVPGLYTPEPWSLFDLRRPIWSDSEPDALGAPKFVSPMADRSVRLRETITLGGYAQGEPPLNYQWYFNGQKLQGASGPTYQLGPVTWGSAGRYSVLVQNTLGSIQASCQVTVLDAALPQGMVRIPAGTFQMGNCMKSDESWGHDVPVHAVYVSEFLMDRYEVTKALWDEVYDWAVAHGYDFEGGDGWRAGFGKASDHPVYYVNWYDCVKWCNARSERELRLPVAYYTDPLRGTVYRSGRIDLTAACVRWDSGYRLPTAAEWERAARGGVSSRRFASGDTISHGDANYYTYRWSEFPTPYDVNAYEGYHPTYAAGGSPYTSPGGVFAPNGYGVYDMVGNVLEWCWDWSDLSYYVSPPAANPRGPASGVARVCKGGSWCIAAPYCRLAYQDERQPDYSSWAGFRAVLPPGQ